MKYSQPQKICWLIILAALVIALQGCAAKAPTAAQGQPTQIILNKIEPRDVDGKTEIDIEGSEPILQYTSYQLTDPLRLVVDISDASIGKFKDAITVNSGAVTDITPEQKDNIARLEIGLSQSVEPTVYQSSGKLIVELSKPEGAKEATETVTSEVTSSVTPSVETVTSEVTSSVTPSVETVTSAVTSS